jgi:hypothetical protein
MNIFQYLFFIYSIAVSNSAFSQFAGPVGTPNTTAIFKDSTDIVAWATFCEITRGKENIDNSSSILAAYGQPSDALGVADNSPVSLGDSGVALVSFFLGIENGVGPDFAIFENSFSDNFLELAFVEVSTNGIDFVRFPATSNTSSSVQIGAFDLLSDASVLNNLAGKYKANYGTPFDLEELIDSIQLDLQHIRYVRIVDAIGKVTGVNASLDKNGNPINDPFPTEFPSSGFDLDAVAVLNQAMLGIVNNNVPQVYAYFSNSVLKFNHELTSSATLVDCLGKEVLQLREKDFTEGIDFSFLPKGAYFLKFDTNSNATIRVVW